MDMSFPVTSLAPEAFPPHLLEIPQPPRALYYRGILPPPELKLLAVVGSRAYTSYGKQVVSHLLSQLRGYPIGIVSGLALGIDSLAHTSALENDLYTLAVPGSGIEDRVIYPSAHKGLAHQILTRGGGLLTEFEPSFKATKWSFTQRNRIMAGMAHATLVIEAKERSGTLITARMAVDYNRDLLVVPGSIFSHNSAGVHQFLKLGATPVTCGNDILEILGIPPDRDKAPRSIQTLSEQEKRVLELLHEPQHTNTLIRGLALDTAIANALLMQMELKGLILCEHDLYRAVI